MGESQKLIIAVQFHDVVNIPVGTEVLRKSLCRCFSTFWEFLGVNTHGLWCESLWRDLQYSLNPSHSFPSMSLSQAKQVWRPATTMEFWLKVTPSGSHPQPALGIPEFGVCEEKGGTWRGKRGRVNMVTPRLIWSSRAERHGVGKSGGYGIFGSRVKPQTF
jgi:hypothetical protein